MDKIGKYDIIRQIGEGGFGVVYEGLDPFLKRRVAIKTCTSGAKELKDRFYREAEIAGKLQHRNIVTVHDFGVHEEVPYLVQEFLSGEDLDTLIKNRVFLPSERKLEILIDVSKGLEHAHNKGVIHRDIKPGNLRILDDDTAKILDFGIAKLANVASHLTRTGMTVGTAAYLPPEQIRGAEVDHRADLFSFGVTAHELLAGKRPFAGSTISKLFYQILNEPAPAVSDLWSECPSQLSDLVARCLNKDPDDRYPSFARIIRELTKVQTATRKAREKFSTGTTSIVQAPRGLTSLGEALVDEEDVVSGHLATEPYVDPGPQEEVIEPGVRVVQWAQQLLDEGDPAAAQEALRLFLAESPGDAPAADLLAKVESRLTAERLSALNQELEDLFKAGDLDQARQSLAEAGREGFTEEQLQPLQARLEEIEQQTEATRIAEITAKAEEPRRLAANKDFLRATRLLESLTRHYGEHAELQRLKEEIREAQDTEARTLHEGVSTALADDDFLTADRALRDLRRVDPLYSELDALSRTVEEHRAVEKRVGDITKRVESLLAEGHLEAAFAALKAAESQHGSDPFTELQLKLRKLRRRKLDREVEVRIAEARGHLKRNNLAETVTAVERALAIDPDNEDALAVLRSAQLRLRGPSELPSTPGDTTETAKGSAVAPATVKLSSEQIRRAERMLSGPIETPPMPMAPTAKEALAAMTATAEPAATKPPGPTPDAPKPAAPTPLKAQPQSPVVRPPEASPPAENSSQGLAQVLMARPKLLIGGLSAAAMLLLIVLIWFVRRPEAPMTPDPTVAESPQATPRVEPEPESTATSAPVETAEIQDPDEPSPDESNTDSGGTTLSMDTGLEPENTAIADSDLDTQASDPVAADAQTTEDLSEPSGEEPVTTAEASVPLPTGNGQFLLLSGEGVENATLLEPLQPTAGPPAEGPVFAIRYVLVNERGEVDQVLPLPGGTDLEPQRLEADELAKSALFQPASRDGVPGQQWTLLRIEF